MLVLSRKANESLQCGDSIKITVLKVVGNRVTLGIEAPLDVSVIRTELASQPHSLEMEQGLSEAIGGKSQRLTQSE